MIRLSKTAVTDEFVWAIKEEVVEAKTVGRDEETEKSAEVT